ncbi:MULTISPECIES: flagellar basal body-associated protein FliL [Vibrio]|uniref:flagellar basal body-associated protein FliL n=1 Tax=Vibrio TaxID=662 RepID=UPI000C16CA39|nr:MULTISPECIES: flagellar basal body-associated protein FliL [Vibrio]NAW68901.1 flagellar basal body-associated protein FliL [Vibrio sp. V28_P6S34P95]NAX03838.1 flagellar basal body-associated protein FliL [Vibrio sp. V30_P3S12P165]NAX35851.1 flagellar basal body-associated protein FliL [Vibrio sp. V29_P1S30P107]NAX36174.1 flagellar basal body-associated protein FliL [Vibrio sp. V27_P1S3P104]NAX41834.1 flagellar basal body-associated protein FliL [Vibrio sp. V26_P1S5P106]
MLKRYLVPTMLAFGLLTAYPSQATEENKPQLAYFTLEPDLTTNFYTKGKQLGYIQVRIDIMVANNADLPLIELHQPLIRDAVVEMLGKQTEEAIKSLAGRENLRKTLVEQLNDILLPETGRMLIADLLFTKYIYQ